MVLPAWRLMVKRLTMRRLGSRDPANPHRRTTPQVSPSEPKLLDFWFHDSRHPLLAEEKQGWVSGMSVAGVRPGVRARGGLVFKAHRLSYHSTLGLRVIKRKKKESPQLLPRAV